MDGCLFCLLLKFLCDALSFDFVVRRVPMPDVIDSKELKCFIHHNLIVQVRIV